jgi:hypothetical protein
MADSLCSTSDPHNRVSGRSHNPAPVAGAVSEARHEHIAATRHSPDGWRPVVRPLRQLVRRPRHAANGLATGWWASPALGHSNRKRSPRGAD